MTKADRLKKHRISNVKVVAQIAQEPKSLTPEEALDRMKQDALYVIEHYHEEWKFTHITAIRYVNNIPKGLGPKKKKQKQPFKQICTGKRKSQEDTTTIDEQAQLQYKAHWADTDIETTHLEFFLNEKCAQQYKIAHATPVAGTIKTRVSWEPEWTDPLNIDSNPEHKAIREAFDAVYLSKARDYTQTAPPAKDTHLSNLQRQGIQPWSRWFSHLHNHKLQSNVFINLQETNPNLDICPPGKVTIQLQTIQVVSPKEEQTDERAACCYLPDGRCIGYLAENRARMLHNHYVNAQRSETNADSDDFAKQLGKLLMRYKDGQTHMTFKISATNQATISDAIANILCKGLGITKERFASPLNVDPKTQEIWSAHPDDACFGAPFNAYSCKWEGSSQAHPNPTAPEIEAAFRWAIASANKAKRPTLTALIVPQQHGSSYTKWVSHPLAHHLVTLPKSQWKFKGRNEWQGTLPPPTTTKHDTAIFLVANTAGITQYYNREGMEEAIQTTCANLAPQSKKNMLQKILVQMDHIAHTYTTRTPHETTFAIWCGTPQDPATSRRFCRAPPEDLKKAESSVEQDVEQISFMSLVSSYPLQHDAWRLIYTDGSSQEGPEGTSTGAAVYFAQEDRTVLIHTWGTRLCNTITLCRIISNTCCPEISRRLHAK